MKKTVSLFLTVALIAAVACTSVLAVEERNTKSEIMDTVEAFLRDYAVQTLLYDDRDLTKNTVSDGTIALPINVLTRSYALPSGVATVAQLKDNISYLQAKAEYWKGMRLMQDIYRKNLELTYAFDSVNVYGSTARAEVREISQFTYTDCTEPTYIETEYTVDLVDLAGRWLIADVTGNDWFDAENKDTESFDPQAALHELEANIMANEPCVISGPEVSPIVVDDTTRAYNGKNAAAYAYTYTRNDSSLDKDSFYNQLFKSYGSDCMNFASQCIWAGFNGSQEPKSILLHSLPMDDDNNGKTEGETFKWYGAKKGDGTDTLSWRSCKYFRYYLTGALDGTGTGGSNALKDKGMQATIIHVPAGSQISGMDLDGLVGAIAHTTGRDDDGNPVLYGHAIVITDVTGSSGKGIYYCGHTSNVKNAKIADRYADPFKIIIPRTMRCGTSQTGGMIYSDMLRPFSAGSTKTISASVPNNVTVMGIEITDPNTGKVTSHTAYSTNTCSIAYKFEKAGLYKINCYADSGAYLIYYVLAY